MINKNQAISLVNQLSGFEPKSAEVCTKVVDAMFYVGTKSTQTGSLYRDVSKKIDLLSYYLDSDVDVKSFLLSIIAENGLSNYVSEFLYSEYLSLGKYFSFEEIREIETDYLQEAIQRDLPLNVIYDYMGRAIYREHEYEGNERARALIKEYAGRHPEEFLQSLVCYTVPDDGRYSVDSLAKNVWGEWGKFIDYVKSITPRTPVIDEFEEFLEEFVEHGTQNAIPYKFKHIKLERR